MPGRRGRGRDRTHVDVRRVHHQGGAYARVTSIGSTGDRPFVLVPGIGVSSDYYERLAPRLREFGPVHAVDLPGFAGVPHPGRAMEIDEYGDLLGDVLADLGLRDPVLVGHSMGTQVVTSLLGRRPDLTTAVLIGPVVDAGHRTVPAQAWAFLRCAAHEPGRVKVLALFCYVLCGPRWFVRILPRMMRFPLENRIGDVQASTLVLRGEHDAVCPPSWVELLVTRLPDARAWQVPGAAHSVVYEHADTVADLCVRHARGDLEEAAPGRPIELVPRDSASEIQEQGPPPVLSVAGLRSLRGRLREWWGLLRRDEQQVQDGKQSRADAVEEGADEPPG